jgi:hypothetical protein
MTRDDIIRIAREANLWQSWLERLEESRKTIASLEKFAALVAAHEREQILDLECPLGWVKVDDIRARGEK